MRAKLFFFIPAFAIVLAACSDDPGNGSESGSGGGSGAGAGPGSGGGTPVGCTTDAECAGTPETPFCNLGSGVCEALPAGHQIGFKDGSPGSVTLTVVYEPDKLRDPTDLAFNPDSPTQLWVVNHLDDSVIIIERPGEPDMTSERRHDPAAGHFMSRPPALAFGAPNAEWGNTWGTCSDNDNSHNNPDAGAFMGPALMPSRLDIFAKPTPDGLGSHLDMLHSTSFCRGMAHVEANVYFVFNSQLQSLDKYDFHEDHGPGNDDHSDGEIFRYVAGAVAGVDTVPSHLVYDPTDASLYIADTGNKRIAKLDTTSGTMGANFSGMETIVTRRLVDGATIVDVVPMGTLEQPSGIEMADGLLFVTDHATSRFYAFGLDGKLIRQLDTGLPAGSLAGFTFGPDGKIYFVDMLSGRVYRIDPVP